MLIRLPFTRTTTIPTKWLPSKAPVFPLSSSCIPDPESSPDPTLPNSSEFDSKIQSLRHRLRPDTLLKLLNSTTTSDDDVVSALKVFRWASLQKRFTHTVHTYYWMILKLGTCGFPAEMEGLCETMVREGCPGAETALVTLVDAFVRLGRLDEASRVLGIMSSKHGIGVFNLVLGGLVEEKRGFRDVVFVYKEMVKAGVAPNVDTLNLLIRVLFETGRVDAALDQYRRMHRKGCEPDSRTFEIVVAGLVANGKVGDSVAVLDQMLNRGLAPEMSFYRSVIPLFCWENELEVGVRLFSMMRDAKFTPDSVMYGALVRCLCENLRLDDAMELLEQMEESSLTLSSDVLVDVVNGLCRIGKTDEAVKLLKDKHVLDSPPYNALLSAVCGSGRLLEAKVLLEHMSRGNIADGDSWSILIRWLCERTEVKRASQLLGRMIVSSLVPNSATYSALVVGNCRSSKYDTALQLFHQLRAIGWVLDPSSYTELIQGLCKAKKYMEAVEVFCYMSEENRCPLDPLSFHMLVKGTCDSGMVKEALNLRFVAFCSGADIDSSTYNYLLSELSKLGNASNLLAFLSLMLVQGCNLDAEAYCILIRSMATSGQTKASALFLNKMVDDALQPDPDTLHHVLTCLADRSEPTSISRAIDKLTTEHENMDSAM